MRKIIATLAMLATLGLTSPALAKNPECRFGMGVRAMRRTIWCVSHRLGESGAFRRTALYVAGRESGFQADAVNPYSGTCGIYQHVPTYWPSRFAAYRSPVRFGRMLPGCLNGRTNVIVSLHMARAGGWSPWSL